MTPYLAAFGFGLLASSLVVPRVLRFARRRGLFDPKTERKTHANEVPRLGGVGIFAGLIAGLAVALPLMPGVKLGLPFIGLLGGALIMFGVGLADDLLHGGERGGHGLNPLPKLLAQMLAAAIPIACGISMKWIKIPGDGYFQFAPWADWLLTLVWVVGIANAVNWLDGLDGLAGGVSAIMATTLALLALGKEPASLGEGLAALALLGGIIGFLRLNFPPARIYMGDGGAMLIGYLLAVLSVSGVMKSATALAVGAPMLILALPLVNLTQVVVGRVLRRESPMKADRTHLHDRLQDAGWSDYSAVLFIYAVTGLCGSAALSLMDLGHASAAQSALVAALLVYVAARRPRARQQTEAEQPLEIEPTNGTASRVASGSTTR